MQRLGRVWSCIQSAQGQSDKGTEGEGRYKRVVDGKHAGQPMVKAGLENMLEGFSPSGFDLPSSCHSLSTSSRDDGHSPPQPLWGSPIHHVNTLPSMVCNSMNLMPSLH